MLDRKCSIAGCEKVAKTKGVCEMHYMRFQRHGSYDDPRGSGWGKKSSHPLYITWMGAKRGKILGAEWDDFWKFVADVGEKPGPNWRLYRLDSEKPYEPGNVRWREGVFTADKYESKEALQQARYEHRKAKDRAEHDPVKHREHMLKKMYGLTSEKYEEMLRAQGGVCAICKRPETRTYTVKGVTKIRPLCVDHCHNSRKVRELLCSHCNTALGLFEDRVELFQTAIDYLKRHPCD